MGQSIIHFPGIGTLGNMLLIVAGSLLGMFFGKRFPERIQEIVMQAAGLTVFFIGVSGMLSAVFSVTGGKVVTNFTMLVIVSLIVGSIIGELLNLEGALQRAGDWLQHKLQSRSEGKNGSRLAEGFCIASILYCTGAMAIVGAMNDALLADPTVLYSKGIIDGMVSIVFAATYGVGVLISALSVGVYQGLITALATLVEPLLTDMVIAQMSAVGSLIIVAISSSMLEIKKFRIGNMLPAIFIPLVWYGIQLLLS